MFHKSKFKKNDGVSLKNSLKLQRSHINVIKIEQSLATNLIVANDYNFH